jgi:hypothetical protein
MKGFDGRLRDVVRRRKVRLTDFEVDDGLPGGFEGLGGGEYLERRLRSETLHARCELHVTTVDRLDSAGLEGFSAAFPAACCIDGVWM